MDQDGDENFNENMSDDENYEEVDLFTKELQKMWNSLKQKLDCIYNEDPQVNLSFLIQCYDEVHNYAMQVNEQNKRLRYEGKQEFMPGESHKALRLLYLKAIQYIESRADNFAMHYDFTQNPIPSNDQILSQYSDDWRKFQAVHKKLQVVFKYLDRFFVPNERADIATKEGNILEIFEFSLKIWRDKILHPVQEIISEEILNKIKEERNGKEIDRVKLSFVSKGFIEIGKVCDDDPMKLYKQLESKFIESTRREYQEKSRRYLNEINLLKTMTFTDYIDWTHKILENEKARVESFMHGSSVDATISVCEECLIKDHDEVFNRFFKKFLSNDERHLISSLYKLISRFPENFGIFKATFKDHIVSEAKDKISRLSDLTNPDAKEYVEVLTITFNKYQSIVANELEGNTEFQAMLVNAAEDYINENVVAEALNVNNNARLFARYCNVLLSTEAMLEGEVQVHDELKKSLECFLSIIKFTNDKVGFLKNYETITLPRIIFRKSKSDELEEFMILQLQKFSESTNKEFSMSGTDALNVNGLKGISENLKTSKDINDLFKAQNKNDATFLSNFSVMVVDERNWPYVKSSPYSFLGQYLSVLPVFESTIQKFDMFYKRKYSGGKYPSKVNDCSRKLRWLHNLGKGELNAQLSGKRYILLTGAFQTAILMAFNDKDSYSFQELRAISGTADVPKKFLLNTMKKLFESKILICSGDLKNLDPDDAFISINSDFQSKKTRLNLETALHFDDVNEQIGVDDNIQSGKDTLANLAMVRTFKRVRRLEQNNILYYLTLELKPLFKPDHETMKKAIDYCVKNSYIKLDENDAAFYVYIE